MSQVSLPGPRTQIAGLAHASPAWPAIGVATALAFQLHLAFTRAINWDEFFHYSNIYQFLSGELTRPLLSLHARLFAWVPALPGELIDHIIVIRLFMFACLCVAASGIFVVAERFANRTSALLAVLAYLSAGFVLQHGSSFRFDPMAAAALMTSLAILTRSRLGPSAIILIGLFAALAFLVTIKSVLYAPAFAGIAALRWSEAGHNRIVTLRLLAVLAAAIGWFALLYALHAGTLAETASTGKAAEGTLTNAAGYVFRVGGIPQPAHALKAMLTAPILAVAIALLPIMLSTARETPIATKLALGALALPICTIFFYQNSFAYFYVFILAPVACACAFTFQRLSVRYSPALIAICCTLLVALIWMQEDRGVQQNQRQLLVTAERIFPEPVAYFDFPAMLGSFPKANAFMTHWGVHNYRNADSTQAMASIMQRVVVPLVIANDSAFDDLLTGTGQAPVFRPEDVVAVRDTYINFWGPFWIAGEELSAGESREVLIRVPGPYTARGGNVMVNDRLVRENEVVILERSTIRISAIETDAQLIWGNRLEKPTQVPPAGQIWTPF